MQTIQYDHYGPPEGSATLAPPGAAGYGNGDREQA